MARTQRLGLVEHFLQSFQHRDAIGENSIGQQKRIEEVDAEESQIRQLLKQPFGRGRSYMRYFAGVQFPTEPDVHVVLEQVRIVRDRLRHRDGTGVRQRGARQAVAEVDVVHALRDIADPGSLFL